MKRKYKDKRKPVTPEWLREIASRYSEEEGLKSLTPLFMERADELERGENKSKCMDFGGRWG